MDDQEFIEVMAIRVMYVMFSGCETDSHLGHPLDPGSWSVGVRADELCRLLDLAKRGADAQAQ